MVFCGALIKFIFDSELNHLGKFVETKQRKRAYSVYCTEEIRAVLTTHRSLMSTKHLIAVGARPKGTYVTLSAPSLTLFSFRLELRRNRQEDLKATGEILRSKLLLGQEDPAVRQVNWRRPPVRWPDLQQTCMILVNKCIIIWVNQTFVS